MSMRSCDRSHTPEVIMSTPTGPTLRLTQQPSHDRALPRTVGQAIVLKLRRTLAQYPLELAAFCKHCTVKPNDAERCYVLHILFLKGAFGRDKADSDQVHTFGEASKKLDPNWRAVIEACASGEGPDFAIRDWPGETSVPAPAPAAVA
jgi:hypothetical protein